MAQHKLNPNDGETWFSPTTFNAYRIHSLSPDGWVRYQAIVPETGGLVPTVFTMETLRFIDMYKRQESTQWGEYRG